MIAKTFEYYRVVNSKPTPEIVEARKKAASQLSSELKQQKRSTLLALVQGITKGFDGSPIVRSAADSVLRTLKVHDPAISEQLDENEMELRCSSATAVGELLADASGTDATNVLASSAIAANAIRPLPSQKHLRFIIEDLVSSARASSERLAQSLRKRTASANLKEVPAVTAQDLATPPGINSAILSLQSQLLGWQKQTNILFKNSQLDREEIDLFWFVATGLSKGLGVRFSELHPSRAAVHAAVDLAGFTLNPPSKTTYEVLRTVIERGRKEEFKPVAVKAHIEQWQKEDIESICRNKAELAELAGQFPAVFPTIWIAKRMQEAGSTPNWAEFKRITGISGEQECTPTQLGKQLFAELVAGSVAQE